MKATVSFGRIGGIPVGAHWSALVIVLLLGELLALNVLPDMAPGHSPFTYLLVGAAGAAVFVLSLLAHEVAHAMVARHAGLGVRSITLWLLGGVSELVDQPQRPGTEIRIALVGPAVSLGLAGVFGVGSWAATATGAPALASAVLLWLATVNLMLGIFNLLPGTPLDGGRVVHGLVWRFTGSRERATRAAGGAGQFLGALVAGLGVLLLLNGRLDGLWLVLVGWFLTGAAAGERVQGITAERLAGLTAGDVMRREPYFAPGWWTVAALVDHLLGPGAPPVEAFPVIDFHGRPTGWITLTDLARVPLDARPSKAVRDVARPLRPNGVVGVDEPALEVLRRPIDPAGLVVTGPDGRAVGVIGLDDVRRVVELQALRAGVAPTR
ncbi:MAG TPA: site-2 protease family protein [Pseudonocardia sp.]|jgi:Zn-dependent protease/CBS domain-containing protein|uniref:site-2 protease family protein n=1 Tax=Pseudonocardia sp. TaxID=60912 RepID=UPI002B4B81E4|nr:site-2 protease family protein [Pseudonocardia sp.]HLU56100.1 site-2 protease family protein [Pseudonocardia sp.]